MMPSIKVFAAEIKDELAQFCAHLIISCAEGSGELGPRPLRLTQ